MYILDTHSFLWFLSDSDNMPVKTKELICSEKDIAVSIASLWEIAIKKALGKLDFEYDFSQIENLCYEKDIMILPIKLKELDILQTLEHIHGDPFDRLIICQTISNAAVLITKDSVIPKYPIRTVWN